MNDTGWFKVARHIFSHPIADDRPWCKGFMWLYLVSMASHDEQPITMRNRTFLLKRGQLSVSTNDLATKAGWSRNRVVRFLSYLHKNGMIQMHTEFSGTLIKIVNYEKWQTQATAQATAQATEQATAQAEQASLLPLLASPEQATAQATEQATAQANKEKSPHTPLKKEGTRSLEKEPPKVPKVTAKTKPPMSEDAAEVLAYLNQTADNQFRNPGEITARLAEGHTVEECKIIIDKKAAEWLGTEFGKNLNPITLFRPIHFDTYLHQKSGVKQPVVGHYTAGVMKGKTYVVDYSKMQSQANKRPTAQVDMSKILKGD